MSPSKSARLRGLGLVLKVILGLVAMCLSKVLSYVSLSSTVQMCAIYFANFDLPPHYSDTSSLQSASLAGFYRSRSTALGDLLRAPPSEPWQAHPEFHSALPHRRRKRRKLAR